MTKENTKQYNLYYGLNLRVAEEFGASQEHVSRLRHGAPANTPRAKRILRRIAELMREMDREQRKCGGA